MEQTCSFDVPISKQDIAEFSRLTGDRNPLHNDPEYARTTEFGRPIGHGAFLVGLLSRVLGMHIPGKRSLILSMRVQFPKPLFFPTTVRVNGGLLSFSEEHGGNGTVKVTITDQNRLWTVLDGEVRFALHALTEPEPIAHLQPTVPVQNLEAGRTSKLLVTGGTGGLGRAVCQSLSAQFPLACLTRRAQDPIVGNPQFYRLDLEETGALEAFLQKTSPQEFYGIVHLSAPPVPRAFVSDDPQAVQRHLRHSVEVPLALAKWARQPGSGVKRLVLLGSTAGTKYPKPATGAYSLGKAAMEHLTRLLVSDMAAQMATVNIVIPTIMPVGINEGLAERARKVIVGKMPTGRLVGGGDVANVIAFLLSDAASQINGAAMFVDGGLVD